MGWKETSQKILVFIFIVFTGIATVMPLVWADETGISVTFDPDATIYIDVTPKVYDFGSVQAGQWKNSTGSTFTLYNNGTISIDTQIKTNATTDSTQLTLDADGSPTTDAYSFRTYGLDSDQYITTGYAGDVDTALGGGVSKGFDLSFNLGISLTQNFTTQRTTIYLLGSVS